MISIKEEQERALENIGSALDLVRDTLEIENLESLLSAENALMDAWLDVSSRRTI